MSITLQVILFCIALALFVIGTRINFNRSPKSSLSCLFGSIVLGVIFLLSSAFAHAEGFYVQGGLAALDSPPPAPKHRYYEYDINDVRNPYGVLAFGYDVRWRVFVVDVQLMHQSSIPVGDRGQNSLRLNVRWYPFGSK